MATEEIFLKLTTKLDEATKDFKKFADTSNKALSNIQEKFNKLSPAAASFIGNLASTAVSKFTSSLVGLGGTIIDNIKQVETMTTQFEVLTGSTKTARKAVKDLQEFSAKTPFQLEGLATASTRLLGFGFSVDEVIPRLQEIGDVAAASNQPVEEIALIFGQVAAAGKLTGERLLQFQERAIPIGPAIAKTLGVAETEIRKLVTAGKVTTEVFNEAFALLSKDGEFAFRGMEKQSKTLAGVLSTLSDNFKLLTVALGEAFLPFLKAGANALISFVQLIKSNLTIFQAAATAFGVVGVALLAVAGHALVASGAFTGLGVAASAAWVVITGPIGLIVLGIAAISAGVVLVIKNFDKLKAVSKDALAAVLEFSAKGAGVFSSERSKELLKQAKALREEADALRAVGVESEDLSKKSKDSIKSVRELTEAEKKLKDEALKVITEIEKQNLGSKLEQQLALITEAFNKRLIAEQEFEAARAQLQAEIDLAEGEAELQKEEARQEAIDKEIKQLQDRNDLLMQDGFARNSEEIRANEEKLRKIEEQERIGSNRRLALQVRRQKQEQMLRDQALSASASFFGDLMTLSQDTNSGLFKIAKAAALATAIVQGFLAVQNALASIPPPVNFIVAAATAAKTAVQVKGIAATGLQEGIDSVPGTGTKDVFPAMLAPGERVVPAKTNKDLTEFISNNAKTNQLLGMILNRIDRLEHHTVVNIGARELINEINMANDEGVLLTA